MMDGREQRIREIAYELWEKAGRPDGREAEHWSEAERRIETDSASEDSSHEPIEVNTVQAAESVTVTPHIAVKRKKKPSIRPRKPGKGQ